MPDIRFPFLVGILKTDIRCWDSDLYVRTDNRLKNDVVLSPQELVQLFPEPGLEIFQPDPKPGPEAGSTVVYRITERYGLFLLTSGTLIDFISGNKRTEDRPG